MPSAKIKNTTNYARTGVVTIGVPFSKADNIQSTDTFVVAGAYTGNTNQKIQWYPQGARWDNGAIKYARMSFKTDLAGLEEKTVSISKSVTSTPIPFVRNNSLWTSFIGSTFDFQIQGFHYLIPTTSLTLVEGGQTNDHYARYKYFTHLPNQGSDPQIKYVWVELVAEVFSSLNYIQFYFRFGFYRFYPELGPTGGVAPVMILNQNPTLTIIGPRTKIRWEEYKVPNIITTSATNKTYHLIDVAIYSHNRFAAGMSHAYKGVLTYETSNTASAELQEQILAMAEDWKFPQNYPITGVMPSRPSYIASDVELLARSEVLLANLSNPVKQYRNAYNWSSINNNPNCWVAGTHGARDYAYGMRGYPFLSCTNYNWIPFLEFTTRQQATVHNWFYSTTGVPITPTDLQAAGCKIWGGCYYPVEGSFAGFTRANDDNDRVYAGGSRWEIITAPDKEHFTNTLFILQGFVTMDYFSLEYAKMYSKMWIYSNRTDAYQWYPQSAIHSWGSPRAVGRVSQVAAFLYEFGADSELKYWIERRLDFNYSRYYALAPEVLSGGPETVRAVGTMTPCGQGACLGPLDHWRPWEEGQSCWGLFLLAKSILSEEPTNAYGLKMMTMAKNIAATVLQFGFYDVRQSTSRRVINIGFPNTAAATSFLTSVSLGTNVAVRGQTSNATGTIFLYHRYDEGAPAVSLYLKNALGTFITGEVIRLDTGLTGTIHRIFDFFGLKSHALTSSLGYARGLSNSDLEHISNSDPATYPSSDYPVGYLTYLRLYSVYSIIIMASAAITHYAASENFYSSNNAQLKALANEYLTYFSNANNVDNSDIEEYLFRFTEYLVPLNLTNSQATTPSVLRMYGVVNAPTCVITNQRRDATAQDNTAQLILLRSSTNTVITTTSIDVTARPASSNILLTSSSQTISMGNTSYPTSSTITLASSIIEGVNIYDGNEGPRRNTYIYFGSPLEDAPDKEPVHEYEVLVDDVAII